MLAHDVSITSYNREICDRACGICSVSPVCVLARATKKATAVRSMFKSQSYDSFTGCGKTFTMSGVKRDPDLRGITPRTFDHIFRAMKISQGKEFLVRCSYIELYNEEIRDLLGDDPKAKLQLKEHPDKGVYIKDCTEVVTDKLQELDDAMEKGEANRTVGATLMNATSSRSHSLFSIVIEASETDAETGKEHVTRGKLNLVDLAGSERPAKTGATGARMKEGIKINMSLTALGNVISALVDSKSKHIPYRDSKLTRLLQDSLGGNTKTVMMAAIGPADYNYEETLSTLRYANRAKNIKNKPIINEDPKDALLRQYKEEIDALKKMLQDAMGSGGDPQAALAALMAAQSGGGSKPKALLPAGSAGGIGAAEHNTGGTSITTPVPGEAPGASLKGSSSGGDGGVESDDGGVSEELRAAVGTDDALDSSEGHVSQQELESHKAEAEAAKAQQADLAAKLSRLQSLLDKKVQGEGDRAGDAGVAAAAAEAATKATEHEQAVRRRREAKLKAKQRRLKEEAAALQAEVGSMQQAAAGQEAMLAAMAARHERAMAAQARDLRAEAARDKDIIMTQLLERDREAKLFEQIVEAILPPSEMAKLWERAQYNEDSERWTIPVGAIRAGKKGVQGGLPLLPGDDGRGGSPASGGGFPNITGGRASSVSRGSSRASSRGQGGGGGSAYDGGAASGGALPSIGRGVTGSATQQRPMPVSAGSSASASAGLPGIGSAARPSRTYAAAVTSGGGGLPSIGGASSSTTQGLPSIGGGGMGPTRASRGPSPPASSTGGGGKFPSLGGGASSTGGGGKFPSLGGGAPQREAFGGPAGQSKNTQGGLKGGMFPSLGGGTAAGSGPGAGSRMGRGGGGGGGLALPRL